MAQILAGRKLDPARVYRPAHRYRRYERRRVGRPSWDVGRSGGLLPGLGDRRVGAFGLRGGPDGRGHGDDELLDDVLPEAFAFGELAEGYEDPAAPGLEELIAPHGIVEITRSIGRKYAAISRALRSSGSRLGDNDLWIGATALEVNEPLVTHDLDHFSRIAGLSVTGY